jgi:ubiquinone/menaquinone biosynthesis C-methylase UbiE
MSTAPLSATKFSRRSSRKEIMDDLEGAGPDWQQALRELKVINQFLGGNSLTLEGIAHLIEKAGAPARLHIADIGCGGGDMLLVIARWARKHQLPLRLLGVDANPYIIEYARKNTAAWPEIEYLRADIFSESFRAQEFDMVSCTLFTHHFSNEQLVRLLSSLHRQVRMGVVVNDLHRHPLAYYSIKAITRLFSRSHMVKHDAPVSVLRAFSRQDWENILQEAGIGRYRLHWRWAFRWMLMLEKT